MRAVAGPHAHAAGLAGFGLTFAMWMVMMVAMMLPPVSPWILLYASMSTRSSEGGVAFGNTGSFVAGYFAAWACYCLAAAALQCFLQHQALMHSEKMILTGAVSGYVFVFAGLFQLTPLKEACLKHCRSPLGYFLTHWRDGPAGAFRMGIQHGIFCLGCCWVLMALCLVLGMMNLLWMAGLTLMLCVEKILPTGQWFSRIFGIVLMVWGGWIIGSRWVSL